MGLHGGQFRLLLQLLLLFTHHQPGAGLAAPVRISYVPWLSSTALAGRLTQSTFALEQPWGQFSHPAISDVDAIWLVVAHSNGGCSWGRPWFSFCEPRRAEDAPAPANFPEGGYHLTMRAPWALYLGSQAGNQLRVLCMGNDTCCSPTMKGCNHPLPGPGPYRVKFLVMNDRGPVAETQWSNETHLQPPEAPQAAPRPRSTGTVIIVTLLSVLLTVLLTALLALLLHTCFSSCGSMSVSGPGESACSRRYDSHHMVSPPAVGGS
ncbi:uroplakin-3b-like protein 1 [Choloepus didactylus]|uniref:uroplakin-3b-like protein 1 n=1 Tax=Choloepus didactylus TaxID=27675 RepID=UPI0018A02B19|nr:uroplakin-3b-like protein 1 [Choloepus didactylus]